jgi:hypothetical protein
LDGKTGGESVGHLLLRRRRRCYLRKRERKSRRRPHVQIMYLLPRLQILSPLTGCGREGEICKAHQHPNALACQKCSIFRNQSEAGGIKSLDDCKHSSDWPFSSYNKTSTQKRVEGTNKVILEEDPTRYLYSTADRLDAGKRDYRYFQPVYVHAFAAITSAVKGFTTNSLTRSGGLPCSGGRLTGTLESPCCRF